jgi:hypothetical protein
VLDGAIASVAVVARFDVVAAKAPALRALALLDGGLLWLAAA